MAEIFFLIISSPLPLNFSLTAFSRDSKLIKPVYLAKAPKIIVLTIFLPKISKAVSVTGVKYIFLVFNFKFG